MSVALHIWVSIHHMIVFFCCTSLKWWHLQMLFSFFQNFGFLGCKAGEGRGKGKKMTRNEKKLSHSVSLEMYLIWLWFVVFMCEIYPAIFFHFFKILIFRVFQRSSINAKRKFWKRNPSSHVCDFFGFFTFTCKLF